MNATRRRNSVFWALWANAAVMLCILVVLLGRGGWNLPWAGSVAHGEQPAIAGGGGVFIMPGQLSVNTWGCYLLDIDHQTIAAYRYTPGDRTLTLEAARNYRFDLQLSAFNTRPMPQDIRKLVEAERNQRAANPGVEGPTTQSSTPGPMDGRATPAPHD